jgi:C-terminal processing protease CtpA/Prc
MTPKTDEERLSTRDVQDYDSVQNNSERDEDDEDWEEDIPPPREQRRRPTRRCTANAHGCTSWYPLVIGILTVCVCVMAAGLYSYRNELLHLMNERSNRSKGTNAATVDSNIYTTPKSTKRSFTIHYDPSLAAQNINPQTFDDPNNAWTNHPPQPLVQKATPRRGYFTQPSLYNNSLVFVAEGDVYYSTLNNFNANTNMPAMKLTTTIGNINTPVLLDNSILVYTATYSGHRDVYAMSTTTPTADRLTYSGTIRSISSRADAHSIIIAAPSDRVSLPDTRLYEFNLQTLVTTPIPLAQATEGTWYENCFYFCRYKQSSRTARYVGGTAESLWMWCRNQALAVPLTSNYNGTSKHPLVATYQGAPYLMFLSDRNSENKATTMNLWVMPLPTKDDVYNKSKSKLQEPIQLSHVSCRFNGQALQEYTVDPVTNHVVLRVGADLYLLKSKLIQQMLAKGKTVDPVLLPIQVYSDFHEQQERMIKANAVQHMSFADVFDTAYGTTSLIATMRGQTWVLPVSNQISNLEYQGAGQNLPPRRYRVVPGATTGGMMRVLKTLHVPLLADTSPRRLAVVLATDPKSPTAEHAFYLIEVQSDATNAFGNLTHLPVPFLGGSNGGGSTRSGGLGSVIATSAQISACGRRMAWADTDGRINVMTLPIYLKSANYHTVNAENENGEPMDGTTDVTLTWSPGGRYLAVEHQARNQFSIITIVDCGDPGESEQVADIELGRHVQVTPHRFNSYKVFWGKTSLDKYLAEKFALVSQKTGGDQPDDVATTLYFITDRDIVTDVSSPWGSRAPYPHFPTQRSVWALPLVPKSHGDVEAKPFLGLFAGSGALELFVDDLLAFKGMIEEAKAGTNNSDHDRQTLRALKETQSLTKLLRTRKLRPNEAASIVRYLQSKPINSNATKASKPRPAATKAPDPPSQVLATDRLNATSPSNTSLLAHHATDIAAADKGPANLSNTNATDPDKTFPIDMDIEFGSVGLSFARMAYRLSHVPKGNFISILTQTLDDGSLVLAEDAAAGVQFKVFAADDFPNDRLESKIISASTIDNWGLSTDRSYLWFSFKPDGKIKVIENTASGFLGLLGDVSELKEHMADAGQLGLSVWPRLEYNQMFSDAWRMLRDYFYDPNMHGIDWPAVHKRYLPLVQRCSKREDLDDALAQMASELSALHVFVYGGEYNSPLADDDDDQTIEMINTPGSLGVTLIRSPEWKGYKIVQVPQQDPDFNMMDNRAVFCPLSDETLRLSGQKGLQAGDVIVAINGESVMQVPDINLLLRGSIGRSVRLEVIRLASGNHLSDGKVASTESVIVSPIEPSGAGDLFYNAWEWKTRVTAKSLAKDAGFTVGYIHMRSMLRSDEDAFARGFFPDYDSDALILDVRHNNGGNIDSWILGFLQRKSWMYWQSRTGRRRGDLDWDEQFAFRGHIVVLIDELTASDGEGVSRGMSELGLGKLIGTRTWGGGIWLKSDNTLVDDGIASAPEIGTYNDKFGWGLGIEQQGVVPDVLVDNNPRSTFDGVDTQLERAIQELKAWLVREPIVIPNPPEQMPNKFLGVETCPVSRK